MHTAALHLATVLAAEKSKTPFYIGGAVLVAWALFISLVVGMSRPAFPSTRGQQRAVMAVTVVLVLFAVSTAVVTAGGESKSASAEGASGSEAVQTAKQSSTPTTSTAASAPSPTATTGTPAPGSSPAGTTTSLKLAASPAGELAYDTTSLVAKAGTVEIALTNSSPVEHDVTIAQGSTVLGHTPTFAGGSKTLSVTLRAGTYTFYCSVPGHRQAGMEGTLTVS